MLSQTNSFKDILSTFFDIKKLRKLKSKKKKKKKKERKPCTASGEPTSC